MKYCPYCAEEIQDQAIKCRFCGEWIVDGNQSNKAPAYGHSPTQVIDKGIHSSVELKSSGLELPKSQSRFQGALKWLLLYFAISCVAAVRDIALGETGGDLLTAFIPRALGGAAGAIFIGVAIGVFAAKDKGFIVTAILSFVALALSTLGSLHRN